MKYKLAIIFLVILAVAYSSYYFTKKVKRSFEIDACLDKGCGWNDKLVKCDCLDIQTQPTDYYWHTDYDTTKNTEFLVKGELMDSIKSSPIQLVEFLNNRESESKIEWIEITGDTANIKILNEEYLAERMGSTGAYCYLGETVFTLTEHDSIKYVNIQMEYGSHAGPGVYSRNDFKSLSGDLPVGKKN